jgi:UDPglucose--hexose-1-phosphate uridylyltransferase
MLANIFDQPHRRFNALTGKWIFVLPHRIKPLWQGLVEPGASPNRPNYDPQCYASSMRR